MGDFQRMAEEEQTTPLSNVPTEDKKRKRNAPKNVPEAAKKKARRNLTLDLSQGTVRFDEIVLIKMGQKQKILLLKRYPSNSSKTTTTKTSDASETFAKKIDASST